MATLTRQQLINLINRYIYANGQQRITAAQLNEILLDIADSFVIEGGGTANGIDAVLAAGSAVTAGRKITNPYGGSLYLAGSYDSDKVTYYTGLESANDDYQSAVLTSMGANYIASFKRLDPEETIFEQLGKEVMETGEVFTAMIMQSLDPGKEDEDVGEDAIGMVMITDNGRNHIAVKKYGITSKVQRPSGEYSRNSLVEGQINNEVVSGPQSSFHTQSAAVIDRSIYDMRAQFSAGMNSNSENWSDMRGGIFSIGQNGVKLSAGRKLGLTTGGTAPTAGLISLSSGSATITTGAVQANSIISLTVQESGVYTGRIRVSGKMPGTGFTISSSVDTDTCSVFWQIIDL